MPIDFDQSYRIRTGFTEWAPTYDDDTTGYMQWVAPKHLGALLDACVKSGDRILDLGCGTGQGPEHLNGKKLVWTGVDLCTAMLKQARERGTYREVRRMNVERKRYPFPSASFEAVMAGGVLEFTDKLGQVLKEIHRLLVPGGHVAFSVEVPERGTDFDVLDSEEFYYIRYRYSEAHAKELLKQAHLELVQTERINAYRSEEGIPVRYACFLARRD